jgi:hypothetical protein
MGGHYRHKEKVGELFSLSDLGFTAFHHTGQIVARTIAACTGQIVAPTIAACLRFEDVCSL